MTLRADFVRRNRFFAQRVSGQVAASWGQLPGPLSVSEVLQQALAGHGGCAGVQLSALWRQETVAAGPGDVTMVGGLGQG